MFKSNVGKISAIFLSAILLAGPAQAQNWNRQNRYCPSPRFQHSRNFENHQAATTSLPPRFATKVVGGQVYYYANNSFYQKVHGQYVTVPAPQGSFVAKLPREYQTFFVDGKVYYRSGGVYYQATQVGFKVVPQPRLGRICINEE